MSVERPDFLTAYNAVEVPDPLVTIDAGNEEVHGIATDFFESIQSSLDLSPRSLEGFFEYDLKMLAPLIASKHEYQESDDYIRTFRKKGGQALAAVMYMRDDFNNQITHFSKYRLRSSTITTIRELQHLERIEAGLE